MAIFIGGKTRCGICGGPVAADAEVEAFPAFVSNRLDPLFMFSDGVFHAKCFEGHPLSEAVSVRFEKCTGFSNAERLRCLVCGAQITDPDDYFSTGFLTDDPTLEASKFNLVFMHRSHFREWKDAKRFEEAMRELERSGTWGGPHFVLTPLPDFELPT